MASKQQRLPQNDSKKEEWNRDLKKLEERQAALIQEAELLFKKAIQDLDKAKSLIAKKNINKINS